MKSVNIGLIAHIDLSCVVYIMWKARAIFSTNMAELSVLRMKLLGVDPGSWTTWKLNEILSPPDIVFCAAIIIYSQEGLKETYILRTSWIHFLCFFNYEFLFYNPKGPLQSLERMTQVSTI